MFEEIELIRALHSSTSKINRTDLITLYFPADSKLWLVREHIDKELSHISNIKDKVLSKSINTALQSIAYQLGIIKTIPDIIKNHRPYLLAECFGPSTKDEKLELYDLLTGYHYSLYRIDERDFNHLPEIKREDIATKKTYNFLAIPREKEQ